MFEKLKEAILSIKSLETLSGKALSYSKHSTVEHLEHWGNDHPDKTFYVIRRSNQWGIMSIVYMYLNYFDYALRRGWIPVVDLQNVSNLYLEDSEVNEINAWEYYFEQPCSFSLDDIKNAKNVVMCSHLQPIKGQLVATHEYVTDNERMEHWKKMHHHYINEKPEVRRRLAELRESVFGQIDPRRILGVYARGTDYVSLHPKGHSIQPTIGQSIDKAYSVMKAHGYEYIYLVTEDEEIYAAFKNEFGDKLLSADVSRYEKSEKYIWESEVQAKVREPKKKKGLDYLTTMMLLLECDGFIGGLTGGTTALMTFPAASFSYKYIWDLGVYR